MIRIKAEPPEFRDTIVESCHFCGSPTRTWHENTNNPVCVFCAAKHMVKELPDHGRTIRNRKRREARRKKKVSTKLAKDGEVGLVYRKEGKSYAVALTEEQHQLLQALTASLGEIHVAFKQEVDYVKH